MFVENIEEKHILYEHKFSPETLSVIIPKTMIPLLTLSTLVVGTYARPHNDPVRGILGLGGNMLTKPTNILSPDCALLAKTLTSSNATVTVSPLSVKSGEAVTVLYSISESTSKDWVAFYCNDDLDSVPDTGYFDYVWTNGCGEDCEINTSLISGRQSECEFRFFTETVADSYVKLGR